jgi:hypothetical protein
MARIGGRNLWIAVPAGLMCAAVVAALVWLALPMIPVAIAWVGDTLRAATSRPLAAPQEVPARPPVVFDDELECHGMYPSDLWTELVWTPDSLLSQTRSAPATSVAAVVDALTPTVRLTCSWRARAGAMTISTTLARVGADAVSIAGAALRGAGFACTGADDALSCHRTAGHVIEEHTVRDGFWLSSVETAWHPDDYGERLAAHLFG